MIMSSVYWNLKSLDETLVCDRYADVSSGTVYCAVEGGSNFWVCARNPIVWPLKWKLLSRTFMWYCLLCCTRLVLTFMSQDETWLRGHSNESCLYSAVLSRITVCCTDWLRVACEPVNETLVCSRSNESYWKVHSWVLFTMVALFKMVRMPRTLILHVCIIESPLLYYVGIPARALWSVL